MRLSTFTLGNLATNCFLLDTGREAVAVDAGADPSPMLRFLAAHELRLTHILLTHLHADHVAGVRQLAEGAALQGGSTPEIWGSAKDRILQDQVVGRGGAQGYPLVPAFELTAVEPGRATLLDMPVLILDTPGHTPGSLSYFFPRAGWVFVGDTLFHDSVGRTVWQGSDAATLLHSIRERLFILPPETVVHAGHGPATTIGRETTHNPFFR